jgi:hypothetical protein
MSFNHSKMYSKNRRQRSRNSGIALIAVLWTLLLLTALAGAAAFLARTNAILTQKQGEFAQAEATADAAIVNAISLLSDEKSSRHPSMEGQAQSIEFQGFQTRVSISREAGRIDVNTAADELILAFLNSQGVPEDRAGTLLDDLRKAQQVTAGPAPAGVLRTIEELKGIPSWAAQDLGCWKDSLTVYTGLPGVSVGDATEQVKAALKWERDHRMGGRGWALSDATSSAPSDRSALGEVLRIVATASSASGISVSHEWVGRLTGDAQQPTLTMRWSREADVRAASCEK